MPVRISPELVVPDRDLSETFVRASGPGGQNVNKVSTAVELRFDIGGSTVLTGEVKARLRALAGTRVTDDDVLVIDAREHRTQSKNREAARTRLSELISLALVRPRPRRKTRPTAASKARRIEGKVKRAQIKRGRRRGTDID